MPVYSDADISRFDQSPQAKQQTAPQTSPGILTDDDVAQLDQQSQPDAGSLSNTSFVRPWGGQEQTTNNAPITVGNPTDLGDMIGRFGRGVYEDPLMHIFLKPVSDMTGSDADAAYAGLGPSNTISQKIAEGLGSAVPIVASSMVGGEGIEGAAALTKGIPVVGKSLSFIRDTDLANAAVTGMGYGTAEAMAHNADPSNVGKPQMDVEQNALHTGGQFLMWGAISKLGATVGGKVGGLYDAGKVLPKDIPTAEAAGKMIPKSIPPEQVGQMAGQLIGRVAGGAAAGTISAPDRNSGIAGAVIGGALSVFNPVEKYRFGEGAGELLGKNKVDHITGVFGPQFRNANETIKTQGMDSVETFGKPGNKTLDDLSDRIINGNKALSDVATRYRDNLVGVADMSTKERTTSDAGIFNALNTNIIRNSGKDSPTGTSPIRDLWTSINTNKGLQNIDITKEAAVRLNLPGSDTLEKGETYKLSGLDANNILKSLPKESAEAQYLGKEMIKNPYFIGNSQIPTELSYKTLSNFSESLRNMKNLSPSDSSLRDTLNDKIDGYINSRTPGNYVFRNISGGSVTMPDFKNDYMKQMEALKNLRDMVEKPATSGGLGGSITDKNALITALSQSHWNQDPAVLKNVNENIHNIEKSLDNIKDQTYQQKYGPSDFEKKLRGYQAYQIYNNPTPESMKNIRALREGIGAATLIIPVNPILKLGTGFLGISMAAPKSWISIWKGATRAAKTTPSFGEWLKTQNKIPFANNFRQRVFSDIVGNKK